MKHPDIQISAGAYLLWAGCILLLPLNWIIGWLVAVSVHEAGHLMALLCCRTPIYSLKIGCLGAEISTGPITAFQELLCAAAGPMCSLLLILSREKYPIIALLGFVQGIFNLLPVYPFDGGRMLRAAYCVIRDRFTK